MKHSFPNSTRSAIIVFVVGFSLFIAPLWSLAAARPQSAARTAPGNTIAPAALFVQAPAPQPTPNAPAGGPNISATKAAAITDSDADGKAELGETITYTITISNAAGSSDALNVVFSDTIDSKTTFVAGSAHASPQANNETYTTIGNTLLEAGVAPTGNPAVTSAVKLFDNDSIATPPDTIQLSTFQNPSANGGTVSVNADGSFTYLPAVGFTGTDTFTYTIRNNNATTLTDTGTVTVNVNGPRVWYVNNSGGAGDGRSSSPFNSLTPVNGAGGAGDADAAGDIIYLFTGAANYTTGLIMENNEQLIGNGVALVVNTITLRAAGTRPTMATTGITLGSGNTLSGFNYGNASGFAISGTSVGTLAINNMAINTTGGGLDLTGVTTPTVNVVLDSLTSSGGTKNVNLVGLNGTVTLGTGALSGATNNAFDVSGAGNAVITYSGTIGNTAARSVTVANKSGGSVSLSGAVSGSGTGISLTGNTGATISFTGGISLSTGTNAAFTATGGGTVTATQNNTTIVNTLTTTTGAALNVANTTIGAGGLTFRSITSNGSGSANGITLDNAGTGGFTVTGNGGTCTSAATCTGGTISNKTGGDGTGNGIGIYVNNTSNVSFTRMKLNDFSNYAVRGTNVTTFTMNNCFIDGANGDNPGADEGTIIFDGLFGTNGFSNDTVRGAVEDNFRVANTTSTAGTVNIDTCTIGLTHTTSGNDNVNIRTNVNANLTVRITGSTFSSTNGDHIQTIASDQSLLTIVATGNTLSGGAPNSLLQGITISGGNATPSDSTEVVRFNISNNNMTGTIGGGAININEGSGNGNWQGQVANNTIGNAATACSGASTSSGIRLENHSKGVLTGLLSGNVIRNTCGAGGGISLSAGDNTASGLGNGPLNATLTGNTIANPNGNFDHGVVLTGGGGVTGNTNAVCLDMLNNNSIGSPVVGSSGFAYRIRQRFSQTVSLPGYTGANNNTAAVAAYFAARPNTAIAGDGGTYSISHTVGVAPPNGPGNGFVNTPGGAPCAQPTVPTAPDFTGDSSATTTASSDSPASMLDAPSSLTSGRPFVSLPRPVQQPAQSAAIINRTQPGTTRATAPNAPNANLPVTVGTLPAGQSVTITFQVTVNNPFPTTGPASVSNQGTVSGSNFVAVNTNTVVTPVDAVRLSIGDVMVAEGAVGNRTVTITVNLSQTTNAGAFTVHYQTADNTATAPADYTAVGDTVLNVPGNALTQTFTVQVKGDTTFEGNENFFVNLSNSSGNAAILDSQGIVTIADDEPQVGDFVGSGPSDGLTDAAVWNSNNGNWFLRNSNTGVVSLAAEDWGRAALGDIAVPGDYDFDNKIDIAIWRPSEGNWYILQSSNGTPSIQYWGQTGDKPVQGDYDADGRTDLAVYRPSEGKWYVKKSAGGTIVQNWGIATDKPVVGDFDGDGKSDLAVFRGGEGNWYIINSSSGTITIQNWGLSTDKLVPGDYDGDGRTDMAVYRNGDWFIRNSNGGTTVKNWGNATDLAVPGDYDGDGKFDISIWRPSEGKFYTIQSSTNTVNLQTIELGGAGVVPIQNAYLPQ